MKRAAAVLLLAAGCSPPAPPAYFPKAVAPPGSAVFDQAALQVEHLLRSFADRLEQRAAADAALCFASDFTGAAPLSPLPPGAARTLAAGRIEILDAGPTETSGPPAQAVADFLRAAPEVFSARFKMPELEFWERGAFGKAKLEISGRTERGRFARQEQFEAVLVLRDGEWSFLKLRRTSAREVRAARPFVADVSAAAGLVGPCETGPALAFSPFNTVRGVASGDLDGDGWLDLVLVSPHALHVFRNLQGTRFQDVTAASGLRFTAPASAVLAVDVDGDGDLDLAVSQCVWKGSTLGEADLRSLVLWRNEGGMKFVDATAGSGLAATGPATGLAAADVDGNGTLDLYVCMYGMHHPEALPDLPLRSRNGAPNQLWINRGDGTFVETGAKAGVADTGFSYAAAFGDLDDDGRPDLYVANDFGPHRFFRNRGGGAFEESAGDQGFGMGVSWGDADNDGDLDLYVSNMYSNAGKRLLRLEKDVLAKDIFDKAAKSAEGNTLLRNDGGRFTDATAAAGVGPGGWAWSNAFVDLDNDGRQDLYVVNGYLSGFSKRDT